MISTVEDIQRRHFPFETHPYRVLEGLIETNLGPQMTVLDIGCGRTAPNLRKLTGRASVLIGIDLVAFCVDSAELRLLNNSVAQMHDIDDTSIDLAYSRSVMEHIDDAPRTYAEINRVLKPGGKYLFLTPSFYDYASLISYVVPNALHPMIVKKTEGREEEDTFPAYYRTNTKRRIRKLAAAHGFSIARLDYLGQYPSYLKFSRALFWLGTKYEKFLERNPSLHFLRGWILCILVKHDGG